MLSYVVIYCNLKTKTDSCRQISKKVHPDKKKFSTLSIFNRGRSRSQIRERLLFKIDMG